MSWFIYLRPQPLHRKPPNARRQQTVFFLLQERQHCMMVEDELSFETAALRSVIWGLRLNRTRRTLDELEIGELEVKSSSETRESMESNRAVGGAILQFIWCLNWVSKDALACLFVFGNESPLIRLLWARFCCWLWRIALRQAALQVSSITIVSKYWFAKENRFIGLESIDKKIGGQKRGFVELILAKLMRD